MTTNDENWRRAYYDRAIRAEAALKNAQLNAERYLELRNNTAKFPAVYLYEGADDTDWSPVGGPELDAALDEKIAERKR